MIFLFIGVGLVIGFVMLCRKALRSGRARLAEENALQEALRLQGEFGRQFEVLTTKLKNGEEISPAAVKHFEYTYKQLMPLLLSHRFILNSHIRQTFRERGDYSDTPDVVKACEQMHNHVTRQIQDASTGSATEAQAIDDLFLAFGSELESLQNDFTREGLARLRERAESLKLALPQAAKYWNVEKIEIVRRLLAKTDETVASLGKENAEGADLDESNNPYKVLGVAPTASMEEIKVAYKEKAKKLHPDLVPDELKELAEEKFKSVQAAYETLTRKVKAVGAS
jgi:DnaJ-domain-containing protein 1